GAGQGPLPLRSRRSDERVEDQVESRTRFSERAGAQPWRVDDGRQLRSALRSRRRSLARGAIPGSGPRGGDRATENRRDELREHLIRKGIRIGRALEGEAVQ